MGKHKCKYCEYETDNNKAIGGHMVSCKSGPNREKWNKSGKLAGKKRNTNITKTLVCKKCNSEYEHTTTKRNFEIGKHPVHCSTSCALTGRKWTDESKAKASKSSREAATLTGETVKCETCGSEFYRSPSSTQRFCNRKCASTNEGVRLLQSESKKALYEKHPEKHPNRKCAGKKSYWQNILHKELKKEFPSILQENKNDGYWMDICDVDNKINIEYDGVHWHDPIKDAERDAELVKLGWRIKRISSNVLCQKKSHNFPKILQECIKFICE